MKRAAFSKGVGVKSIPTNFSVDEESDEEILPPKEVSEKKYETYETWSTEPSVVNQELIFPRTVKWSPWKFDVFDLSDPEHVGRLNKLQDSPMSGRTPRVMIELQKEQFCEQSQNWKILLKYSILMYQKIRLK